MKINKILKIISSIVIGVASLLLLVFSIINIAKGDKQPSIYPLLIVASVLLIVSAIISATLSIADNPHHFDVREVVSDGLMFGFGIFVALPVASDVASTIVGYLIPALIVGVGSFFIVATIVSLVNKINKKSTDVIGMIIGLIMVVGGALLMAFEKDTARVTWLIIAIILLISSITNIVKVAKEKEEN